MTNRSKKAAGTAPAAAPAAAAPASEPAAESAPAAAEQAAAQAEAAGAAGVQSAGAPETGAEEGGAAAGDVEAAAQGPDLIEQGSASAPLDPEGDLDGRIAMVRSVSARGRWRIGRHFTQEPSPVAFDDLTEDETGRLLADPELIVSLED